MKFYLSSYRMGRQTKKLKKMLPRNKRTAFIPNALDYSKDVERRLHSDRKNLTRLRSVGLRPEILDLREYFGKQKKLERKLRTFGAIWIRGGNTFVLRQAMQLSGFDKIFKKLVKKKDMLYGGYSAGICILSPSLRGLEIVDDPKQRPYGKRSKIIWDGLGVIDYAIAPHYKSKHPESKMVDKTVKYFIDNKMPFKALRDGEVIIIK